MKLNFGPRGILQIDDARIVYRNFSGRPSQFNREGDRNFSLVIPNEEIADALVAEGWNVKIKPSRDDQEMAFMTLPIKIKFNERGPKVYLKSDKNQIKLNEDTVSCLDNIDISSVDLDVRPYDWEVSGKTGRTAYLQAIYVTQEVDRFEERFASEEFPCEEVADMDTPW